MFINKVFLYGNLTRDPELKALPSGLNVASFGLATNRVFKDRDGKKQEQTEFHSISVFGRSADLVAQYLKKGSSAFIEGRLQTRSWEKNGEKHYRTEIVADNVQFGPRSGGGSSQGGRAPQEDDFAGAPASSGSPIDYPKDDINPDDIPF